jgi:hypothetical protein
MKEGEIEAMKRRLVIIMTFLAVGRAGEAACSTWTSGVWNHEHGNLDHEHGFKPRPSDTECCRCIQFRSSPSLHQEVGNFICTYRREIYDWAGNLIQAFFFWKKQNWNELLSKTI